MADLLFDFNIKKTAILFDEDLQLKKILYSYGLYIPDIYIDEINPERIKLYEDIASLFLADHAFISSRSIEDLWALGYSVTRLNQLFNKSDIVDEPLFRQIFFTYKYSSIKHFFQDNFTKFLPSPDAAAIDSSEKMKIFQTSFMKEYDRFADIIDNIYNIVDVDKVDNTYLAYLIQILGYEKGDDTLLSNSSFRELAKNIIEVYKMKGTNYSFELFFNFLGFNIILKEFWFDKRFSDPGISINPYTNSANADTFAFYLTPYDPTSYIPENMNSPYQVMKNQLTDIRSHLWFEKKIQQGISAGVLLGNDEETSAPEGFDYSFFKTNVISYEVTRIRSQDTDADELSPEDEKIINAYADFLTPIFIMKQVSISVSPFEDVGEMLILTDSSYYDRVQRTIVNMYRQHVEKFIIDDWVDDPLEPWSTEGRIPLRFTELTDVDASVDNEEPSEVYIWLNYLNDDLKNIADADHMDNMGGSIMEFASGNLMHVQTVSKEYFLSPNDYTRTLWDIAFNDINPMLSVVIGAIDDSSYEGPEGLEKIVDYCEDMFNRIQRTESLDIFSRDYIDWDDFKEIRHLPSFADSTQERFTLNTFEESTSGSDRIYTNNDELLTDTPWLFFDYLNFIWESSVGSIIKSMSGRILSSGSSYRNSRYVIDRMIGGINSIAFTNLPSLIIPAITYTQLLNIDGSSIPKLEFSRESGLLLLLSNGTIINATDYNILTDGIIDTYHDDIISTIDFNRMMIGDIIVSGFALTSASKEIDLEMFGSIIINNNDIVDNYIDYYNIDTIGLISISSEDILGYIGTTFYYMPEVTDIILDGTDTTSIEYQLNVIDDDPILIMYYYNTEEIPHLIDYLTLVSGETLTFGNVSADVIYYEKLDTTGMINVSGEFIISNDYIPIPDGLIITNGYPESVSSYIPISDGLIVANGYSESVSNYIPISDGLIIANGTLENNIEYLASSVGEVITFGETVVDPIYIEAGTGYIPVGGTTEQYNDYTDIDSNGIVIPNGTLTGIIDFNGESSGMTTIDGVSDQENHYVDIDSSGFITIDGEQVVYDDYVDIESNGLIIVDGDTGLVNDYVELDASGLMVSSGDTELYADYVELDSNGTTIIDGTADVEVI